jgi:dihydroflavonol-4-reductase
MPTTVLVTGGTGFIGAWTIVELLKRGYCVRTTVRSLDKSPIVRTRISESTDPSDRLSFFAADLLSDEGWDAAVDGCDYVLHIASPVGHDVPRDANVLIAPARDGALRVLRAACRARVQRVVLTSAVEACRPPLRSPDGAGCEDRWTDTNDAQLGPYRLSKTIAERAAWDFMAGQSGPTTLTTILPVAVLGPILSADNLGSVQLISRLLDGRMPGIPNLGFCVVDVRDVVDLHIRAMTAPQAAGERFIAASDWVWMADVAHILRSALGSGAKRVPTRRVADWVLRIASIFDRQVQFITPLLGRKHVFSAAKAQAVLGWKPRSAATTIIDCAESLIAKGAISPAVNPRKGAPHAVG